MHTTAQSRAPHGLLRQKGQSLVELAISLMVMVLLLSGAVSFGMAYFSYVSIRDAAQEGALYGSFAPCDDIVTYPTCVDRPINLAGICDRVQNASEVPVNLAGFDCVEEAVDPNGQTNTIYVEGVGAMCEGGSPPNAIRVSVRYGYPVFMPLVGAILGDHVFMTASATDTILKPRCPAATP